MAEPDTDSTQPAGEGGIFECESCASRQLARDVPYNAFGYPVCPVCKHEHGPRTGR